MFLKALTFLLPWSLRYRALNKWFHYRIHSTAKIGFAWIFPKELVMAENCRIDHFSVAINLDKIEMEKGATIGRSNWITGFPSGSGSLHFQHQPSREAALYLGEAAAVTKHHHIDCTNRITIGAFATIAGYYSQLLTHSINVVENIQDSSPINIGAYTFVGTNVVILGSASLPSHSVLGAKSLLNKPFETEWRLYAGVPAKEISIIAADAKYFFRKDGYVY